MNRVYEGFKRAGRARTRELNGPASASATGPVHDEIAKGAPVGTRPALRMAPRRL